MKMHFTSYLLIATALAAVASQSIQAVGQPPNQKNGPPNPAGPYNPNQLPPSQLPPSQYSNPPSPGQYPSPSVYSSPGMLNALGSSNPQFPLIPTWLPPSGPSYPTPMNVPNMPLDQQRKSTMLFIDQDGSVKRIAKELGTPFSQEEIKKNFETRQELESALMTIKSPDSPESAKNESKQLIANYLKAEFQWDQESRREQLDRLEKQVEQIKKQLAKREESQDKLIELRMQLLENDALGLSFPDSWSHINNPLSGTFMGLQGYPPNLKPSPMQTNPLGSTTMEPGVFKGQPAPRR